MFSKLSTLFFIVSGILVIGFLSCGNPSAASDEVLFVNKSDYYIVVTQNMRGDGYIFVWPNSDNKFTGVESSFSVKITYGPDNFMTQTTLKSDYGVSPEKTLPISKDLKVSKS